MSDCISSLEFRKPSDVKNLNSDSFRVIVIFGVNTNYIQKKYSFQNFCEEYFKNTSFLLVLVNIFRRL